jgi:tetratricopeptide (TPR) repeat protein
MRLILALALLASPAFADCPAPVDARDDMLRLIQQANDAPSGIEGRKVSGLMWELWLKAPDGAAQEILDEGLLRLSVPDFAGARATFDKLTEYCPAYAEGFNQRAYVNFLRQDYEAALVDLDRALDLQPLHVAAQAGRALTLMNLGRLEEARAQLQEAVDNNPWLNEAALLKEGAPLGPKGRDI